MIIDILLLLFLIAGFWLGYTRGFIKTILMFLAYFAALVLTLKFSPWVAERFNEWFKLGHLPCLIFGTIFILVVFVFLIHRVARRLERKVNKGDLTRTSKIVGGIVQMTMALLIYCLLLWPINQFGMLGEKAKTTSISYPVLQAMPEKAKSVILALKPVFSRYWEIMENTIEETKAAE